MSNSEVVPGAASVRRLEGPEVSTRLYGCVFTQDSAGLYPGLELVTLLTGASNGPLPQEEKPEIHLYSHDFSRQLVWGTERFSQRTDRREKLFDERTEEAVRDLLECLQLPIRATTKPVAWERGHFFPYTRSLVHSDARELRKAGTLKISIQRRYMRGEGAYAFKVLRLDPDQERRARISAGLDGLYPKTTTSKLDTLAATLRDAGDPRRVDDIEHAAMLKPHDGLEDLYRDGVHNLLSHQNVPGVTRVRALMTWTAFWLLTVQHARSAASLNEKSFLVVDCGASASQLRRASQRCLRDRLLQIETAVRSTADEMLSQMTPPGRGIQSRQISSIRLFFSSTAANIGLLNDIRGTRHFTVSVGLLEMLVLAAAPQGSPLSFERFLRHWLFERCRLVIGRRPAEAAGLLETFDGSIFERNEELLAQQLQNAGLLTVYSDSTRMVRAGDFS